MRGTVAEPSTSGAPPVRVYGLEHRVPASPGRTIGVDWSVKVSAPGRTQCEVEFWFMDRAGNAIEHATTSAQLDERGFIDARGTTPLPRASAARVHQLSAKASCI